MSASSSFSVQLLSKIGTPLVQAIETVSPHGDPSQNAENMAKMLGMAAEMSISLHDKLGLTEDKNSADDIRTALAVIAAELIAGSYKSTQKLPEENDKNRMLKALESVLGFSNKFSGAVQKSSRLLMVGSDQPLFDEMQPRLITLQSVSDIINAVAEFPFGKNENDLIQDIIARLEKDAGLLVKETEAKDKLSELIIFKSLAALYAVCHRAEGQKISKQSSDGKSSLDSVWAAYETRIAMTSALIGGDSQNNTAPIDVAQPPVPVMKSDDPQEPTASPSAPASAGSNGPMGFFTKKKEGEENIASEKTVTPDASSAVTPPPSEPDQTTIENPIEMPEDEILPKDKPDEEKPISGGSPMSFFKTPPKKEEGEE